MITNNSIFYTWEKCRDRALQQCALKYWSVKPNRFGLKDLKTAYGRAGSNGNIEINSAFIGTTAINTLIDTINHELAHLIIGLHNGHNRKFKQLERAMNKGVIIGDNENIQIIEKIYPLKLYAITDREKILLGHRHKRSAKFTKYDSFYRPLIIKGQIIKRFEYLTI